MNNENDKRDTGSSGRRASDYIEPKEVLPSSGNSVLHWIRSGLAVGGVVSLLFYTGRASHTLDTVVVTNVKQDNKIELIITQLHNNDIEQNRLLLMLENQVIQQNKSDGEFLREMRSIGSDVKHNSKAIVIMNGKISARDNTSVMRLASLSK